MQSRSLKGHVVLVFKALTILNVLVNRKASKQAGPLESEGDKVTVVVC